MYYYQDERPSTGKEPCAKDRYRLEWSMLKILLLLGTTFMAFSSFALEPSAIPNLTVVNRRPAEISAVEQDLQLILQKGGLSNGSIRFEWKEATHSKVAVTCKTVKNKSVFHLNVEAPKEEWGATFYYGIQKLGFLFPHPRMQINPTEKQMQAACGQTYEWKPRFAYRGFHFHTMHPSEWLQGFLMGQRTIAEESLRWLARNGQNIAQVVLLDQENDVIAKNLEPLILFGHKLGVNFGIDVSFNLIQQKAYRLIGKNSRLRALGLIPGGQEKEIRESIDTLSKILSYDFMTIEIGSSEFTSSGYRRTINWMNVASEELVATKRALFIKVHASAGMVDKEYGNFNFIPQYANANVGVLPHTVMYFSLTDKSAPVYGREDFKSMADFTKAQCPLRQVWYYPETSYFIAMDIDVPLLLTDYLLARSQDMDDVEKWGAQGHLNFSTGQELGYWLKDWTVALLANGANRGNPYIGLDLLGESRHTWQKIFEYQNKYFKMDGILEELSSANLLDELTFVGFVTHRRTVFRDLKSQPDLLKKRIAILREAVENAPKLGDYEGHRSVATALLEDQPPTRPEHFLAPVKNAELRALLEVTQLRLRQALYLREALLDTAEGKRETEHFRFAMGEAKKSRVSALAIMGEVKSRWDRYPEAQIFERHENLSSYPFGYGWPAMTLHFWDREEKMVEANTYWPWFMNIYSLKRILL